MSQSTRRLVWCVALSVVLAVLVLVIPSAAVRADDPPNMQDYNTYWQVATDPTPPDPTLDYNTYWAEVQAKQQWQDRQQ
jgi:hypothetical protein